MKKFIILCIALFATAGFAQTINWYVDGSVYQTTTCSAGDDVTPPSAPARRGYTFTGWRDTSIIIGTWAQSGSPTPDNPTYPTFYQDGDLILRAVGSGNDFVADTYSASTGIITRRVGVKVLDGTENWEGHASAKGLFYFLGGVGGASYFSGISTHFTSSPDIALVNMLDKSIRTYTTSYPDSLWIRYKEKDSVEVFTQWLADQYTAGTPVTVYYPLKTPTLENYTPNANLE